MKLGAEEDPRNADEAMLLLGIAVPDPAWKDHPTEHGRILLNTWAAQAGISRPGRRQITDRDRDEIKRVTLNSDKLKWPRRRSSSDDG
jgi:hypothetical protein